MKSIIAYLLIWTLVGSLVWLFYMANIAKSAKSPLSWKDKTFIAFCGPFAWILAIMDRMT